MEELLADGAGDRPDALRPLSSRLFLFGDGDDLRGVFWSLSRDLDLPGKGGLPGEGGRGLPGEGGRPKVEGGVLEKELDRLGDLGGGMVGVTPKAA